MFDATLVTAHSDKESAAATFKGGFGFHPLTPWLDNTGEALAAVLSPGNAGSNTAVDHVAVTDLALAQAAILALPKGVDRGDQRRRQPARWGRRRRADRDAG
ncbi:transposase [Pseudonocardia adelaidensis]|uniref:Transposase DDE domain-containing protein n=1 Tax=Pseudonocardia adelaidensis TaxID=648754 RepID=A0ABP9NS94_9PSEU